MAFSDFPPTNFEWKFWRAAEYASYLNDYADAFDLRSHIEFGMRCIKVERIDGANEAWKVSLRSEKDASERVEYFDALCVAVGGGCCALFSSRWFGFLSRGFVGATSIWLGVGGAIRPTTLLGCQPLVMENQREKAGLTTKR